jgi:hypothetical protein
MKFIKFSLILCCFMALFIGACSSSQDKAYKSQDKIHKERLKLVEQYQKCNEKAEKEGTDKQVCEQYLKASEALK